MPASSQARRPASRTQASSSSQHGDDRNIRDFFKPYTIPRERIPVQDVDEDEIVVASPPNVAVSRTRESLSPLPSPIKSQVSVGRNKTLSALSTPGKDRLSPTSAQSALHLDGAGDVEELQHEGPSGSRQRVMSAVEIPTPTERPSPQATSGSDGAGVNGTNAANMSFNSMSSLTSLPLSSQASSSRRIVRDGVPIVTNSDSGSAEESEDELQDIILPRKKMRMTPPEQEKGRAGSNEKTVKPPTKHLDRLSTGRNSQGSTRSQTPRRRLSPSPPRAAANANSLLKLVREKERREKAEAKIRETETAFETEQKLREERQQREQDLGGGLKALVADDSDEGERMMLAVERTEAMGDCEDEWSYFRGVRDDSKRGEVKADDIAAFAPWIGPRFERLKGIVTDARHREQAALRGFLAEIAETYGLPRELMEWMFSRLVRESSDDLCEAYVEVFRRYLQRDAEVRREDWTRLSRVYRTTEVSAGELDTPVRTAHGSKVAAIPPGIQHVVRVVQYACSTNGHDNVPDRSILELVLASADAHVGRDVQLKTQLQESIAAIIESSSPPHGINTLAYTISNETAALPLPLRCRIIATLPARTKRTHQLRRLLALYLIADKTVPVPADTSAPYFDPGSSHWPKVLLSRLRTSAEWAISDSTDYAQLNALIPALDIALDAGFAVAASKGHASTEKTSTLTFPAKHPKQSAEEQAFNAQIDTWTDTLRALSARIRDAGTSHLRRTEAKSALERVVVRLNWCVRTKPRPRKGVFGGGGEGERGSLSGFLVKQEVNVVGVAGHEDGRNPDDKVSVVADEKLSDREGDSEAEGDGDEGDEF